MTTDYKEKINQLYEQGLINNFARLYLIKHCTEGIDDEIWEEAVADMTLATKLNVDNEEEFRLFHYIDYFAEDLVDEIFGVHLSEEKEDELKEFMFKARSEIDYNDLVSFRIAVMKWLQSHGELGKSSSWLWGATHRNIGGAPYYLEKYNMEYWSMLVTMVNKAIVHGIPRESAVREAASQIKKDIERLDFLAWYQFRFGDNKHLYDVNKQIRDRSTGNMATKEAKNKFAGIYEDAANYYVPKEVFKQQEISTPQNSPMLPSQEVEVNRLKKEEIQAARSKLMSRTFSIDNLLERYRNVIPPQSLEAIEDALNALRKAVRREIYASSVQDYFIKTAKIMEKHNFEEGAEKLLSIADTVQDKPLKKVALDEQSKKDLDRLIDNLTEISAFLKRRTLVRDLAEADLALYDLGIASVFPELTEAQSKLIDAFSYASNKVDDVIPKIRGMTDSIPSKPRKDRNKDDKKDKGDEEPLSLRDKPLDDMPLSMKEIDQEEKPRKEPDNKSLPKPKTPPQSPAKPKSAPKPERQTPPKDVAELARAIEKELS